jgi:hypothetical protein
MNESRLSVQGWLGIGDQVPLVLSTERAKLVGSKLTIWTEIDDGTEIELNIPGAEAFLNSTRRFWRFGKRSATETDDRQAIERE